MRSQLPENTLLKLLRQCYVSRSCQASRNHQCVRAFSHAGSLQAPTTRQIQLQRSKYKELGGGVSYLVEDEAISEYANFTPQSSARSNNHTSHDVPQNIAVLGGGITGLASAYFLARELPKANITLYEKSSRLGGWLNTKQVDVGNGTVVFEQGPRTIRPAPPAGLITLQLAQDLELELSLETKSSPAAQNRFLYYPDHLVRMPGPGEEFYGQLWNILTEPVFKGSITGAMGEYWRPPRPEGLEDESVGSFFTRRFGGKDVPENILSALLHGIYAGDIYQLSIKSIFPLLWEAEREYGSIAGMFLDNQARKSSLMSYRDISLMEELSNAKGTRETIEKMRSISVWSFPGGISTLSNAISAALKANPKITVKTDQEIKKLEFDEKSNKINISMNEDHHPTQFDNVISTLSSKTLSKITREEENDILPSLAKTHSVTVMVVNLLYSDPNLLSVSGFGYLIPRSIPWEQNPERALGVIFDSCLSNSEHGKHTKVTVMLGGHWWDDFATYPDEEEGAAMAKAVLKRHLKIDDEPVAVLVGLQRECIPQYTMGHEARMKKAHYELQHGFNGKLSVAGNSFTGVGINDCVRAARDIALDVSQYEGPKGVTGLEQFQNAKRWARLSAISIPSNTRRTN